MGAWFPCRFPRRIIIRLHWGEIRSVVVCEWGLYILQFLEVVKPCPSCKSRCGRTITWHWSLRCGTVPRFLIVCCLLFIKLSTTISPPLNFIFATVVPRVFHGNFSFLFRRKRNEREDVFGSDFLCERTQFSFNRSTVVSVRTLQFLSNHHHSKVRWKCTVLATFLQCTYGYASN